MKKIFLFLVFSFLLLSNSKAQNCQAGFNYSINGSTVQFQDSSFTSTGNYITNWNFGDGNFSTQLSPVHTYSQSGTYTVCLTISDTICQDSICYTISIQNNIPNCIADFYTIHNGLSVQFIDSSITSSNQVRYNWNFGDGNNAFIQNPVHSYNQGGSYRVSLSIYDSLTNCTDVRFDTIFVQSTLNCAANFSYQVNQDSLFIQNLADSNLLLSYNFGDGNFSTQANPVHIYNQSGSYVVCQTATDSVNCFSTFCDTIQIVVPPQCQAGFSKSINDFTVDILNRASNFNSIIYDFGDGFITSNANPTHIYAQNGTYIICQTVTGNSSCSDTFCDTVVINVTPPCQAGFTYQTNYTQVNFLNQAVNYTSIRYDFGDGSTSNLTDPAHTYSNSGTYVVSQTVSNSNGCSSTYIDTLTVTQRTPCKADFSYTTIGDTTEFTSNASHYSRLIYYFGDGNTSAQTNPKHLYTNSGSYSVKMVVFNDSTGCSDSISKLIAVTISQSCVAKFELALDTNQTNILFLVNTSSADNTHQYYWNFGDGNTSTVRLPTHQYTENKAYKICLTVYDTVQNCTSTYCDSVGLDTNGNILKSGGFSLRVLNGSFIGLDEKHVSFKNSINTYPNPVSNTLIVEMLTQQGEVEFELISLNGRTVKQGKILAPNAQLDLSDLRTGIFFLKLQRQGETTVVRVIKQ